jgi:hypothetical protein
MDCPQMAKRDCHLLGPSRRRAEPLRCDMSHWLSLGSFWDLRATFQPALTDQQLTGGNFLANAPWGNATRKRLERIHFSLTQQTLGSSGIHIMSGVMIEILE